MSRRRGRRREPEWETWNGDRYTDRSEQRWDRDRGRPRGRLDSAPQRSYQGARRFSPSPNQREPLSPGRFTGQRPTRYRSYAAAVREGPRMDYQPRPPRRYPPRMDDRPPRYRRESPRRFSPRRYYSPRRYSPRRAQARQQARPRPFYRDSAAGARDDNISREPASPALGSLIRKMHKLIKLVHHSQNVTPTDGEEPRVISKMVAMVKSMVKPSSPTPQTSTLLDGNARNWGYNTLTILTDHYKAEIDKLLNSLCGLLDHNWRQAFEVAIRWAKRNITRLSRDVTDSVEALLAAHSNEAQQRAPPSSSRPTVQAAAVSTHQAAPTRAQQPAASRRDQRSPVQQPPAEPARMTSVAQVSTMTEWPPEAPRERRQPVSVLDDTVVFNFQLVEEEDSGPASPIQHDSSQEEERQVVRAPASHTSTPGGDNRAEALPPRHQDEVMVQITAEASQQEEERQEPEQRQQDGEARGNLMGHQTPRPSRARYTVRRHENTGRKMTDWDLVITKKVVIIGDSNLSRFPNFDHDDVQIDSYPGGQFRHAQALMEKTTKPPFHVEMIVMAFGINNRSNLPRETVFKNIQGAVRSAKAKFPFAVIVIPVINFSPHLPVNEQENLNTINSYIRRNQEYIPILPEGLFETEADDIHWTKETAELLLKHWIRSLNLLSS